MRVLMIVLLSAVVLAPAGHTQGEDPWAAIPEETRRHLDEQADRLHALVFGWCFAEVRGQALRTDYIDPYESDWNEVVEYQSSNGGQFVRPISSPDGAVFVDLLPDGRSCYIQFESLSTPYVMQSITAELTEMVFEFGIELVEADQSEVGRNSRLMRIPANGHDHSSLMQIHAFYSPQPELAVVILRRGD